MNLESLQIYHDETVRSRVIKIAVDYLDSDHGRAENYAEMILETSFVNGRSFFHKSADMNSLSELDKAFTKLGYHLDAALTFEARQTLSMYFIYGPLYDELWEGSSARDAEAEDYRQKEGLRLTRSVNGVLNSIDEIKRAIRLTKNRIEHSANAKQAPSKINIDGINLVEAARQAWAFARDCDAPSTDLNAATAFGRYLSDLFDACGIEGDPRSAFRAWVREHKAQSPDRSD